MMRSSSSSATTIFFPSAPRLLVLFCCYWYICWLLCCCYALHDDDVVVVAVVDAADVSSSTRSRHNRRYCPPPSSTAAAFLDPRSVTTESTEEQRDEKEDSITTKWIELIDGDSPFSTEVLFENIEERKKKIRKKKRQQIPRSKLIMWGPFNPVDPFQQEYFDGGDDGYDYGYDDDIFSTTTTNNNNNNNNKHGDGFDEHPLRTNIWEFDLKLFHHQFPFLWQRQRRKHKQQQHQQFPKKENCLNSIMWNIPQNDDEGSSQIGTRSSSSSSLSTLVKLYIELHPSGLCRAMMEPPSLIKATTGTHHHHYGVDKNEPPNTRFVWSLLFGNRSSGTSLVDDTSTSSSSSSLSSPSLPVALGSWTSRPWGVIVRLNPLDWNDDDTQVVDVKQQQQQQQRQQPSSSPRRTRRRRRNGKGLPLVQQERTARWISSQEYILTAKAFDYDFFGTNPSLSQGTIVFSNKKKKHLDSRIMNNNTKNKKNRSKQGMTQDSSSRPPLILVRDLYRDVPLVDNRYFGKFGWGKEWFLPVIGTFKASGVV